MTRTELDELALSVWQQSCRETFAGDERAKHFAYALLVEVQKRIRPLGTAAQIIDCYVLAKSGLSDDSQLISLPIIEE